MWVIAFHSTQSSPSVLSWSGTLWQAFNCPGGLNAQASPTQAPSTSLRPTGVKVWLHRRYVVSSMTTLDSISYVNKSNVASQRAHRKAGWVNTNKPVPGNRNSTIWKRRDKMHKTASQIADSVLVKVALRREIKELRKGNLSASDISRLVANQDSAYPSPVLGEWVKIPPLFSFKKTRGYCWYKKMSTETNQPL